MKNINPTKTEAWKKLEAHYTETKDQSLKSLFENDSERATKFTTKWDDFYVDFSKNKITEETKSLLIELANECGLKEAMDAYFGGEAINKTE